MYKSSRAIKAEPNTVFPTTGITSYQLPPLGTSQRPKPHSVNPAPAPKKTQRQIAANRIPSINSPLLFSGANPQLDSITETTPARHHSNWKRAIVIAATPAAKLYGGTEPDSTSRIERTKRTRRQRETMRATMAEKIRKPDRKVASR
ncbi:hypothetical protein IEQ34_002104 [Dendrobium chrysotoxum]|uniref:Uncharacterized protein n=1 Tax=Dendrobium chrysotoxum TaxID=161865 RepID=A0AAV7HMJ8_DENCH|nr:hypothetical protein IEQ34_002104 [Dendrobium chrysotoxum]